MGRAASLPSAPGGIPALDGAHVGSPAHLDALLLLTNRGERRRAHLADASCSAIVASHYGDSVPSARRPAISAVRALCSGSIAQPVHVVSRTLQRSLERP